MPGISYVCLSDTHFGAKNSLLTKLKPASWDTDPQEASPVMHQLVACLRDILSKAGNPQGVTLISERRHPGACPDHRQRGLHGVSPLH